MSLNRISHDDDNHFGSAKRDTANGVAGLDGVGSILVFGPSIYLAKDGGQLVYIKERVTSENIIYAIRNGVKDYQVYIYKSGVWKELQDDSMKNVANGIAGLDASAKIALAQMPNHGNANHTPGFVENTGDAMTGPLTVVGTIYSSTYLESQYGARSPSNGSGYTIQIPVYSPDSSLHQLKLAIQNTNVIVAQGTGDGSGGLTGVKGIAKEPFCLEKGLCKNRVVVAAATYSSLTTDCLIGVTYTATGAVTVTLPSAGALIEGHYVSVIDEGGNANNNNITIDTEGAETISGAATQTISTAYGRLRIYADGANWFLN